MGNGGAFPGKALEELTASELAEGAARLGPSYAAALNLQSISMYVVCSAPFAPSHLVHGFVLPTCAPAAEHCERRQEGRRREDEDEGTLRCSRSLPATALICSQRGPHLGPHLRFALALAHAFLALASHRFSPLHTASHRFLTHTSPLAAGSAGLAHDTRFTLSKGTTLRTARHSRQH